MTAVGTNWFQSGGKAYAQFRPEYPPELVDFLASRVTKTDLALDVGCGNGQLTTHLASAFTKVVGVDPSADQIQNAKKMDNVEYLIAPAEEIPLCESSADLITVAQAAHWFDLPRFFEEARRVISDAGVIALISYGVPSLDPEIDPRFQTFYWKDIAPYWPIERKLVDNGYVDIDFPFPEEARPQMAIRKQWSYEELLGYIGTWSATKKLATGGDTTVLVNFAADLKTQWGDVSTKRSISWPINMRIGRVTK